MLILRSWKIGINFFTADFSFCLKLTCSLDNRQKDSYPDLDVKTRRIVKATARSLSIKHKKGTTVRFEASLFFLFFCVSVTVMNLLL